MNEMFVIKYLKCRFAFRVDTSSVHQSWHWQGPRGSVACDQDHHPTATIFAFLLGCLALRLRPLNQTGMTCMVYSPRAWGVFPGSLTALPDTSCDRWQLEPWIVETGADWSRPQVAWAPGCRWAQLRQNLLVPRPHIATWRNDGRWADLSGVIPPDFGV